jgi:hypothetical protein
VRRVYWNPTRKVTIRAVKSARASQGLSGVERPASSGVQIGVGMRPVMVRSLR